MKKLLVALMIFASFGARAEIYKCKVDGKVVFSDTECKGGGGAVSVNVAPASASKAASPDITATRLESDIRIKKKLINDDIYRSELEIRGLNTQRESILSNLRERLRTGNDSIRGALNRDATASEMVAVNSDFDNKVRSVQSDIDKLKADRDALK